MIDPRKAQEGAARVLVLGFTLAALVAFLWKGLAPALALAAGAWLFLQARPPAPPD